MFAPFLSGDGVHHSLDHRCEPDVLAFVRDDGSLGVHPTRRESPQTWAFAFAHLLCHLGFGHVATIGPGQHADLYDRAAACLVVNRFLGGVKLVAAPGTVPLDVPEGEARALAELWRRAGGPPPDVGLQPGGSVGCVSPVHVRVWGTPPDHVRRFAAGLTAAASAAVDVAGGARASLGTGRTTPVLTAWERALAWFVSSYPLLGALATGLRLVADAELCRRLDIRVAAVSAEAGEIYVNPLAQHTQDEWRFILAHEMLHAALRHSARTGGRDPYLFNVAADFQVNGWLVEMGLGAMPSGLLHDPDLRGLSVEAIYDRITTDLRRSRKLLTLRGAHGSGERAGDLLGHDVGVRPVDGVDLDEFYRRALSTGLAYHRVDERGLLPVGLVEEIAALDMPVLTWEAELARWFEEHVRAPHPQRTYARPSRRQQSTPDIPRPGRTFPDEVLRTCTFGVVLDTSGSMGRELLGKALGSIAAFAAARDVPAVRVVFCDAVAYDAGYLPTDAIAGRVQVRGRGGTVLQPGVDLLERAPDFPADGPVLVITDGACDVVRIRREHAFLVPARAHLPFTPRGPVFRMR
jgi:predicted metal-dependent peptidase